jgi:hypothetical protein
MLHMIFFKFTMILTVIEKKRKKRDKAGNKMGRKLIFSVLISSNPSPCKNTKVPVLGTME